jgi:ketosteroid isomerase-like protein
MLWEEWARGTSNFGRLLVKATFRSGYRYKDFVKPGGSRKGSAAQVPDEQASDQSAAREPRAQSGSGGDRQEHVAIVRKILDAFNRRDVNAVIQASDPQIAFFAPTAIVADRRYDLYRGHDGIRTYFDDVARVWDELRLKPRDYKSAEERVVALGSVEGRPKDSSERLESDVAWAWKLRDGKVVWGRVYTNPEDALADLGLA